MIRHTIAGINRMEYPLDPAAKKAYEIGYALFRVAAIVPSRPFADLLEKEGLELLAAGVGNAPAEIQKIVRSLYYIVSFGKDTGYMNPANADLLIREMDLLDAIMQRMVKKEIAPADLDDIFSPSPSSTLLPASFKKSAASQPKMVSTAVGAAAVPPLGDRQSLILEKIRQSGNCHARDLQAILPDLSERTLRYDLQRLVEQGKIERGGGGGPASWYRISV
jgi:hypothetical protein